MRRCPWGGAPRPGGSAHLPAVPTVDVAAIPHPVQHQGPVQGLHGVAVPLTGVDKGSSCVHQEWQREIANACRQEVAVAEDRDLQRSTLLPESRAGCTLPPWLSKSALLRVGKSPNTGKKEIYPSLFCRSKICFEKRSEVLILPSVFSHQVETCPAVQKCPDYHLV